MFYAAETYRRDVQERGPTLVFFVAVFFVVFVAVFVAVFVVVFVAVSSSVPPLS